MDNHYGAMPVVETILSWRICLNLASTSFLCPGNEDNCKQNNLSLGHGGGRGVFLCRASQFGKFENCAGDFQTGMKIAHIVVQFELKKRISA